MSPLTIYIIGILGAFVLQDGLASIAFYPKESWKWNHTARMVRVIIGLALTVIAGMYFI